MKRKLLLALVGLATVAAPLTALASNATKGCCSGCPLC